MSSSSHPILVSGVKPTGTIHLGNYFGAIQQFVNLQDTYKTRIFIADYHALTGTPKADDLVERTMHIISSYLAVGLDPKKVCLFKQSDVPAHTELAVILSNLTPSSYLFRAHAYKSAKEKGTEINAGVLYYPILMTADILMYNASVVPVGEDQKQHLEYARDIAQRFNYEYSTLFTIPEPIIIDETKTIPGIDGRKMSKSYANTISLFASKKEITEAVMSIPTDSQPVDTPKENYTQDIVYQLHTYVTPPELLHTVTTGYQKGGLSYKESKQILINSLNDFITPFRERYNEISSKPDYLQSILREGATTAKKEAEEMISKVRSTIGLTIS